MVSVAVHPRFDEQGAEAPAASFVVGQRCCVGVEPDGQVGLYEVGAIGLWVEAGFEDAGVVGRPVRVPSEAEAKSSSRGRVDVQAARSTLGTTSSACRRTCRAGLT